MDHQPSRKETHLQRLGDFLWTDHKHRPLIVRWLLREVRFFYFVGKGFAEHQCILQACALTFVTLLSIVPLIALSFSLINAMTGNAALPGPSAVATIAAKQPLSPAILPAPDSATTLSLPAGIGGTTQTAEVVLSGNFFERVLAYLTIQLTGGQTEVRDRILEYARKTNFAAVKAVGVILLIVTVIGALGTIEHVFNQIWGVRRARGLVRKMTDYLFVVIICPLLLMTAMAMTPTVMRVPLFQRVIRSGYLDVAIADLSRMAPYVSVWVALALLYWLLPNTRVRLRYALVGGFAAGFVWQFAFWGYTWLQTHMIHYNLIYSALAALPFFLSWLYVSWLIVLFGAEIAAAYQNIEVYARERMISQISPAERLRLGLNLVLTICARFKREEAPWTADQLSRYLECPGGLVDHLLADLVRANIVMPVGTGRLPIYQPAIPLDSISPARVLEALEQTESAGVTGTATPEAICARTLMEQWREGLWRELGGVGFDRLVEAASLPPAPRTSNKLKT
ncbi:YihY/virulence factor BrkB family protein [Candidatus Sumerlaeota bacterium]|nr:YihY/virulence factor BrkB family protein [Candidatus Sumerlaeota bacterium]